MNLQEIINGIKKASEEVSDALTKATDIVKELEENLIQSGAYCFDCENTGMVSESNGPDDFQMVECHCKVQDKLEEEANA